MPDADSSEASPRMATLARAVGMIFAVSGLLFAGWLASVFAPASGAAVAEMEISGVVAGALMGSLAAAYLALTYVIENRGGANGY